MSHVSCREIGYKLQILDSEMLRAMRSDCALEIFDFEMQRAMKRMWPYT